jgi:hypothetical protein
MSYDTALHKHQALAYSRPHYVMTMFFSSGSGALTGDHQGCLVEVSQYVCGVCIWIRAILIDWRRGT